MLEGVRRSWDPPALLARIQIGTLTLAVAKNVQHVVTIWPSHSARSQVLEEGNTRSHNSTHDYSENPCSFAKKWKRPNVARPMKECINEDRSLHVVQA